MNSVSCFKKSCVLIFSILFVLGCMHDRNKTESTTDRTPNAATTQDAIEVVTTAMDFDMPDVLKSGWTTFRYVNNSEDTHFFIFEKMPEGVTLDTYENELVPPFKAAFTFLLDGNVDAAMKEFGKIPAWWSDVKLGGGVGLLSAHHTAESTLFMNPGTYVMECYVRLPSGMPHAFYGMLKEIHVTKEANKHPRPSADYEISLSSTTGVSFVDSLKAGEYRLAVHFIDQKTYESQLGHDINLVKLDNTALLDTLGKWVNTSDMTAFRSPAPAGLTFLGGVEDMDAGSVGYFNVSLKQGDYVLISEIPNAIQRNMYKTFKVYQ